MRINALKYPSKLTDNQIIIAFGMLCLIAALLAIGLENPIYYGLPISVVLLATAVLDFKKIYYLLFASIPFSVEIYFSGGLATDMPSEPLMWLLMAVSIFYFLVHLRQVDISPLRHPISLLVLAHVAWILVTTITSEQYVFSFKQLFAKIWYVTVFYFLSLKIFKNDLVAIKKVFYPTFVALAIVICICLIRHAMIDFSFMYVNSIVGPFFQNHVMYAVLPTTFMPYAWYATYWHKRWSISWFFIVGCIVLLLFGIQYSYTRTAYVALLMAVGAYFIIRWQLLKYVLIVGLLAAISFGVYIVNNNRFMEYAPEFKKTISHETFDKMLNATYKMQDISTMERVYRWVAAGHMIADKPWLGFGPGNFYTFYKNYTVAAFRTFVSHNPERSSTHCYFIMLWVEQGIFGLLFFLAFDIWALLLGERMYHTYRHDPFSRRVSLMATLSLIIINAILIINDMIETDKIGSFFFLNIAIIVALDIRAKKQGLSHAVRQ
jgi:O-antigen ligase